MFNATHNWQFGAESAQQCFPVFVLTGLPLDSTHTFISYLLSLSTFPLLLFLILRDIITPILLSSLTY